MYHITDKTELDLHIKYKVLVFQNILIIFRVLNMLRKLSVGFVDVDSGGKVNIFFDT